MEASRSRNVASVTSTSASCTRSANPSVVSVTPTMTSFLRLSGGPRTSSGSIVLPSARVEHQYAFSLSLRLEELLHERVVGLRGKRQILACEKRLDLLAEQHAPMVCQRQRKGWQPSESAIARHRGFPVGGPSRIPLMPLDDLLVELAGERDDLAIVQLTTRRPARD